MQKLRSKKKKKEKRKRKRNQEFSKIGSIFFCKVNRKKNQNQSRSKMDNHTFFSAKSTCNHFEKLLIVAAHVFCI